MHFQSSIIYEEMEVIGLLLVLLGFFFMLSDIKSHHRFIIDLDYPISLELVHSPLNKPIIS